MLSSKCHVRCSSAAAEQSTSYCS